MNIEAAPTPVPAPAGRKGGRCCLRSCGCLLLALLLALLAGWLAYRQYGAPWLDAQKAKLTERFPILTRVAALRQAANPLRDIHLTGGDIGSTDPADFPTDVWLPDGATAAVFNTTPTVALAVLTLPPIDPAVLAARARTEMAARGWQRSPVPDPEGGIALLFERQDRIVSMQVFELEDASELWIRCDSAPSN